MVECLARAGCLLHTANKDGETPLHVAAVRGYHNIVRFLAENGANLDATDNVCNETLLRMSSMHMHDSESNTCMTLLRMSPIHV